MGKVILFLAVLASSLSAAVAEEIPLCRQAMEKWEPDSYRAIIIFNAENPLEKETGVRHIENMSNDPAKGLNLIVGRADIGDKNLIDENTNDILKSFKPDRLPFTVIYFPSVSDVDIPLWAGYLTVPAAESICDSPVRREIARRLLKGDDAVWLLIESGDEGNDEKALQMLTEEARISGSALPEMPKDDLKGQAEDDGNGNGHAIPPQYPLKMSIIRMSRDDKAETTLLEMLSCIEPEMINTRNEPAVAAIYGKGRLLDILSAEEVNRQNVRHAVRKLASPFRGEGKLPDTGTDLLMAVSWKTMLKDRSQIDKLLPPHKSFADAAERKTVDEILPPQDENVSMPEPDPELAPALDKAQPPAPVQMRIINIFLVLVIALLAILFVVVVLRMRK